jgi:endonuclease/exonuclease/phosphatase (EEP) superfamily protein YafD
MVIFLSVISFLLIVAVFLARVKHDYWIFKILEYPRLQKLFLILVVLIAWFFFWPLNEWWSKLSFWGLCASAVYIIYKIIPYTVIAPKEMAGSIKRKKDDELIIYSANVLQENTEYDRLLKQISAADPDIIFLWETNEAWKKAVETLKKDYPYCLEEALENTYGLLFYSRYKLEDSKVNYLVKNDIPSIEAILILPSGTKIKLWGVHPEPPVPGENLYSTAKDKELMKIALKARDWDLPCLVFGDLNDVAWSHTTELFRKTSELLDPRRGRGLYSTFSAHSHIMRFPLDYIFCSKHFALIGMQRLPKNGSDHFAICTHLIYQPQVQNKHDQPHADGDELKEAKEIANEKPLQ